MFYDFIYLAKGFRMRPKVRSTLSQKGKNYDLIFSDYLSMINHNDRTDNRLPF